MCDVRVIKRAMLNTLENNVFIAEYRRAMSSQMEILLLDG